MGSRKLVVEIHSIHTNEEDVEVQTLKDQYLRGSYTEFETRRKQETIQKLVGIEAGGGIVKAVVIEWKPSRIPPSALISEYRETCEEIAIESRHSTVTPHLHSKLHRLEELILKQLE